MVIYSLKDLYPSAKQNTYYIGVLEDGTKIRLDTFQIKGLTGERYQAPSQNVYKGWVFDRAVYAERPEEGVDVASTDPKPMSSLFEIVKRAFIA